MSLLFLEEDPWLLEYESCEKLYRDIMEQLTIRQKYSRTSDKYAQLSANIRLRLKQFNNEVDQLNKKLDVSAKSGNITPAETERRTRQLEQLRTKEVQVQKVFHDQVVDKMKEDRRDLIGASSSYLDVNTNASIDELKASQKKIIKEQNEGLENLSQIILRQKDIAHTISTEVDFHNEILDDLGTNMERTDQSVRAQTQYIGVVDRKDNTCIYWVIIILLFVCIVVVACL
ncbi:unnamed protein product [Phaedon cochleariae]|uniref:t-SNARE coiled-coil homology domain-containing protein n=1 Tax=Phaedon cochleariae TaxID=80249 RepID=A0A9P0DT03_PHACE|nr:unnamed protein product [Phaedon cochleariae]